MLKKTSQDSILMENLNLDIDTYSLNELVKLFSIKEDYSEATLENGKKKLLNQLDKINNIGPEKKRNIGFFIDSAANKLKNLKGRKDPNAGTWAQEFNNTYQSGSHYIIENPNVQEGKTSKINEGRVANDSSFPAGYLNPLNVKTIIQGLNIDSRFRDNYTNSTSSDFTVHLPEKKRKVVSMRIGTLDVPCTWYSISRERSNANAIILDITQGRTINVGDIVLDYSDWKNPVPITVTSAFFGTISWLLTLADGNYEIAFQDQSKGKAIEDGMNEAIVSAVPGFYFEGIFYGLNAPTAADYLTEDDLFYSVIRNNGKSVFEHDYTGSGTATHLLNGFLINFDVDQRGRDINVETNEFNPDIQLRLGWQLGFRVAAVNSENDIVTSLGICLITGPRYFYIAIEDGQKNTGNSFIAAYKNYILDKNIMTRVNAAPVMDDVGVFKISSDPGLSTQLNRTREYFGPVNIERLRFTILDEYGRILDLNNMDWSATLIFESLYD